MNLRDQSVAIACAAIAEPSSTLTGGENQQGLPLTRIAFPDADVVYSARAVLSTIGDKAEIVLPEGTSTVNPELPPQDNGPPVDPLEPGYIIVTGTFAADGVSPNFPVPIYLVYAGVSGTKTYWTTTGQIETWDANTIPAGEAIAWMDTETDGVFICDEGDIVFENPTSIITSDNWVANGDQTGEPVLTAYTPISVVDADGNDCYGDPLPAMTKINAVLIECISGGADIEVNGDELKSVSAGEKRLCANVNGIASYLDTMEITATAANTEIRITVIGES